MLLICEKLSREIYAFRLTAEEVYEQTHSCR
jgi:hypothetical protein